MLPFSCKLPSNSFALLLSLEATLLLWQNKGKWHQSLNIFWQSKSWKRQGAAKSRLESFSKSNNKRTFPCSADQSTANNFANQKLIFPRNTEFMLVSNHYLADEERAPVSSRFLLDLNTHLRLILSALFLVYFANPSLFCLFAFILLFSQSEVMWECSGSGVRCVMGAPSFPTSRSVRKGKEVYTAHSLLHYFYPKIKGIQILIS